MSEDKDKQKPDELQAEQLDDVNGGGNGTTVERIMKVNKELKNPNFIR